MRKNENGFTLVEVLASLTILFIVFISFFTVFTQSALFTRSNEETLQATNLANRAMDVMRASGSANKGQLREALANPNFGLVDGLTCTTDALFSEEGCLSQETFTLRVKDLTTVEQSAEEQRLNLRPFRVDVSHRDRTHEIATRHFYLTSE